MGSTSKEEDEPHEPIKDKDITTHQPPLVNDKEKVVRPKKKLPLLKKTKKRPINEWVFILLTLDMPSLPFILIPNGLEIGYMLGVFFGAKKHEYVIYLKKPSFFFLFLLCWLISLWVHYLWCLGVVLFQFC
jgi:hypothetical protein